MIDGLRAMADFLECFPDVPQPVLMNGNAFVDAVDLPRLARLTSWRKAYMGEWFALAKDFGGGVTLDINVQREQVCKKVVTGTRIVPAVEAQPEHEEQIEEWICDDLPILARETEA